MKITIWTIAADTDSGTTATVHASKKDAYLEWIESRFYADDEDNKNTAAAFVEAGDYDGLQDWIEQKYPNGVGDVMDTFALTIEEHQIETPKPALPPDPDGQNDDRAVWAETAILAFEFETGTDREDALADLLCDLMHWADRNETDFAAMLDRARSNYAEETATE